MRQSTRVALPSRGAACCLERKARDSWQLVSGHDEVGSSQGQRVCHRQLLQSTAEPFDVDGVGALSIINVLLSSFCGPGNAPGKIVPNPCTIQQLFKHVTRPTRLSGISAQNNALPWTGALLALPGAWCVLPSAPGCARAPQGTPAFLLAVGDMSSSAWLRISHWGLADPAAAVIISKPTSSLLISSLSISKAIICFHFQP